MGQLLHALHQRQPLPAWAPHPNHYPLPRCTYPATKQPQAHAPITAGGDHGRA